MSEQASTAIRAAIRDHGPITFAEFMELALYGPGGFYERPPVGAHGDFVTSPHVHPVFATLLARAVRELHAHLGDPVPLRITEAGAGDGTLARALLDELSGVDVEYTAVESSPGALRALDRIPGVRVESALVEGPHVVIANELLDNLPFRIRRGAAEVRVALDGDRFVESETPWESLGVAEEHDERGIEPVGALAFVDSLGRVLRRGYAILIDYAAGGAGTAGSRPHGYRDHRVIDDLLADPGSTDITVGVDLEWIARRAQADGLVAFPTTTQREALLALGLEGWIRAQVERQSELMNASEGLEAVRAWSGRSRATLLADPAALGRHRWLVLATHGLSPPSWLG